MPLRLARPTEISRVDLQLGTRVERHKLYGHCGSEAPEFVPSPLPGTDATSMADVDLEGIGIGPEEVAEALDGVAELEAQGVG